MRQNRSARELLEPGQIASVIKVTMRQEDRPDVWPVELKLLKNALQAGHFPHQPCINENSLAMLGIKQQMEESMITADRINSKTGFGLNIV